jgi:hypothetical protein
LSRALGGQEFESLLLVALHKNTGCRSVDIDQDVLHCRTRKLNIPKSCCSIHAIEGIISVDQEYSVVVIVIKEVSHGMNC